MKVKELFDLTGKVAIVTGGGSGLGRQMAEALAEAGADLVLCARKADRCEHASQELAASTGVRALGLGCDLRDPGSIDAVVRRTVDEFGRVDILVNNAGTAWASPPEDMPLDGWQKVIDVNLTGAFLFAQSVGRVLIRQGEGGRIVNVASVAAFRGAPQAAMNALPYNASKAGVVGLTIDLAVKWAPHGITVNAIAPGWFPTEMTAHTLDAAGERLLSRLPLGRYGGPDDLKGAVVYLASAASGYVTGTTLIVDGGQSAS
jgi:gluconate 5-dehydrogenase